MDAFLKCVAIATSQRVAPNADKLSLFQMSDCFLSYRRNASNPIGWMAGKMNDRKGRTLRKANSMRDKTDAASNDSRMSMDKFKRMKGGVSFGTERFSWPRISRNRRLSEQTGAFARSKFAAARQAAIS